MKKLPDNLIKLGFDEWFQNNAGTDKLAGFEIARVTAVHKDSYMITNGTNDISAKLVGRLLYSADSPLDYPSVGDWVAVHFYDDDTFAIIHEIFPRKSLLKRKTPGKKIDIQLIAANIDNAFIMQSLDSNFNLRRLERYTAMVYQGNIKPIILLSKSDLISPEEAESRIDGIKKIMPGLDIYPFSNVSGQGLEGLKELLHSAETYCLLGSSGVGKTTLLNNLIGEDLFKTKTVRQKDSKGRHATTQRQLILLESGAMLIDTPGMRELGNFSMETGINETFPEITELSNNCRFKDCNHIKEKGCAVLKAVEEGRLPEERYRNFIKMIKESLYNEMSYYEKMQKDKQFGKYVKSVMKHKKKNKF